MRKTIFLVFMVALIVTMITPHAYALQYIPYTGTIQDKTPVVCVLDNSASKDSMNMTKHVVEGWSKLLSHLTHGNNWDMPIKLIDRLHMTDCNIVFNYTLKPYDPIMYNNGIDPKPVSGVVLGYTTCDNVKYGHVYCQIDIFLLNNNPKMLFGTAQHEFGHALGLDHRQGNTEHDQMRAFLSDDLMYASAKVFSHITNEDALAVIDLYGSHGFNKPIFDVTNGSYYYLIPYPTHVKTYCNGVSGNICYNIV